MADTKRGRERQARKEERRQRQWEIEQARDRLDEREPRTDIDEEAAPGACQQRNCIQPAAFVVTERFLVEGDLEAIEVSAELCTDHTATERPVRLENAYANYCFHIEPVAPETLAEADIEDEATGVGAS